MLFDESLPECGAAFFREINEATVKVHPEERYVGDCDWLVGQYHMGEGRLYKTMRVVVRTGLILSSRHFR